MGKKLPPVEVLHVAQVLMERQLKQLEIDKPEGVTVQEWREFMVYLWTHVAKPYYDAGKKAKGL